MSKVAIIVPNRNHARYLKDCLNAILSQSAPIHELLVFDDASTDESVEVLRDFARKNSKIRLKELKINVGVINILNCAINETSSDYIAFLAADDFIERNFIERLVTALDQNPQAAFACGMARLVDDNNNQTGIRPLFLPSHRAAYIAPDRFIELLTGTDNHILGPAILYRKAYLKSIGGFDPTLGSLSDGICCRYLAAEYGFVFLPLILANWRIHGSNLSRKESMNWTALSLQIRGLRKMMFAKSPEIISKKICKKILDRIKFNALRIIIFNSGRNKRNVRLISRVLGLNEKLVSFLMQFNFGIAILGFIAYLYFKPYNFIKMTTALAENKIFHYKGLLRIN